ncbi:hypothetical protein F4557_002572 [Actinomadura catellatispora]|uniref:Uncharacterized protein n=1 Tax=Actinomadura livida TaxID=79909 RepID=A0A7W7MXR1_9ACTN|nr:hypothetical protein [Actinomadura catellatispora]
MAAIGHDCLRKRFDTELAKSPPIHHSDEPDKSPNCGALTRPR